tara:strand:- start:758 stop:895 length:138 start_codon:yes stop_codon:yes gene_type:complete
MKKHTSNDVITVPINYVVSKDGIIKYDFKAMRNYFDLRMKILGER